jgi:hypothetical protein
MLRRVRRAMALTTVFVAVVYVPAVPAEAELGDTDPGSATTSTTVDTTPTTEPSPGSTTTTTTTDPSPTRPGKDAETTAAPPAPNWFDPSGLGGLLGVGAVANPVPAGVTPEPALADSGVPPPQPGPELVVLNGAARPEPAHPAGPGRWSRLPLVGSPPGTLLAGLIRR